MKIDGALEHSTLPRSNVVLWTFRNTPLVCVFKCLFVHVVRSSIFVDMYNVFVASFHWKSYSSHYSALVFLALFILPLALGVLLPPSLLVSLLLAFKVFLASPLRTCVHDSLFYDVACSKRAVVRLTAPRGV